MGRKRKNNEDACLRIPEKGVYCVADGMGGQAAGDLASEAIIAALSDVFSKTGPDEDGTLSKRIALVRKGVDQASKWIKNFSDEKMIGQMGSTVVALVLDPRNPARAAALHAGDSRLYRYRAGELKQLTADHSAVAALAAKLGIDPASIPARYQNELLKCVGVTESAELERTPVDVQSGDLFLICSDGLTRMVPDGTIAGILGRGAQDPIGAVAQTLIDGANDAGGNDNISVVLVRVGDISAAPSVVDPREEEEARALEAPAPAPAAEAEIPANNPTSSHEMPDTADSVQGDTPRTDDVTADKTPIPAQAEEAPTPPGGGSGMPETVDAKPGETPRADDSAQLEIPALALQQAAAPGVPPEAAAGESGERKRARENTLGIAIIAAAVAAALIGICVVVASGSRPPPAVPAAPRVTRPVAPPHAIAPAPKPPEKAKEQVKIDFQEAFRSAVTNAQHPSGDKDSK